MSLPYTILCVGGGTMGSVTPLLAVVEELRQRDPSTSVIWWGTTDGPERAVVERAGIPFSELYSGKLRRYLSFKNLTDAAHILAGGVQALWRFGFSRPTVMLAAGSYVAVPAAWAAWLYGVPVCIHQLDVEPGLANKLIAPIARKVTVTFPDSAWAYPASRTVVTGSPVRAAFYHAPSVAEARKQLGLDPNLPVVTVVGGGTGAVFFNALVGRTLDKLSQTMQVLHVTGGDRTMSNLVNDHYRSYPFVIDSLPILAAADVVVTRGGMAFISELGALTKAAVVISMPGTHQEVTAAYLERHKAARVFQQNTLTDAEFIDTVRELLEQKAAQQALGNSLAALFPATATGKVVQEIEQVLNS